MTDKYLVTRPQIHLKKEYVLSFQLSLYKYQSILTFSFVNIDLTVK